MFAEPIRSSDGVFTILARPNDVGIPRLGLAISRKAAKRAVDRNRLKRLARESFRNQRRLPPWDFVVTARAPAAAAPKADLRARLDALFERISRRAIKGGDG